jgi:hypothetical protein
LRHGCRQECCCARTVHRELVRRGYVVGLGAGAGVLRLDHALTVRMSDISGFMETLEQVLGGGGGAPRAGCRLSRTPGARRTGAVQEAVYNPAPEGAKVGAP